MAQDGKKTVGNEATRFKKGNKISRGRNPLPPEIKEFRKITREEVEKVLMDFWMLPKSRLKEIKNDPELPERDRCIINMVLNAGDGLTGSFELFSNYLFGKSPEKIQVSSINQNINTDIQISNMVKQPELLEDLIKIENRLKSTPLLSE